MAKRVVWFDKLRALVTLRSYRMRREIAKNGPSVEAAKIALEGVDMISFAVQIYIVNAMQEICGMIGKPMAQTQVGYGYMACIRNTVISDELESVLDAMFDCSREITRREARERVVAGMLLTKDLSPHQVTFYLGEGERYENWLNEEEFRNCLGDVEEKEESA